MSAQERADSAAQELAAAVAEMAPTGSDGEMVIIIRSSLTGLSVEGGQANGDLLWSWDWFWRPTEKKPE